MSLKSLCIAVELMMEAKNIFKIWGFIRNKKPKLLQSSGKSASNMFILVESKPNTVKISKKIRKT